MIAPEFNARPRRHHDAQTRVSDNQKHSADGGQKEHAGACLAEFSPLDASTASFESADPRKAAVRLREIAAGEAPQLREFSRSPAREWPLWSLSGGSFAPSKRAPTMPACGAMGPASASICLQPATRGEGSNFRAAAPAAEGVLEVEGSGERRGYLLWVLHHGSSPVKRFVAHIIRSYVQAA